MRSSRLFILLVLLTAMFGCGGGSGGGSTSPKTLVSLAVTPGNPSVAVGSTLQLHATGTFSDSTTQDLTASVTWVTSTSSVAVISNSAGSNGNVTPVAPGTATITATSGSISIATALTVTVAPATLVSVAVTPKNTSAISGTTVQFSAIGTFSDNTTQDLTASALWSSSVTSVATISNATGSNGRVTPVAVGVTVITATVSVTLPTPGNISDSTTMTVTAGGGVQANVLPITVNGSLCSSGSYSNKPCVSVTVCAPGTTTCQVVTDLLLDTGSYGLRIFKQALNISLPQVTVGSGSLAECIQFGDGSSDWGPIQTADVILGSEPAVQVPIHLVDATFGIRSRACQSADSSPAVAGFNGILGVGLFPQDCGALCVSSVNNGMYSVCNGSICSGTAVPLAKQVQNPVALLPLDNNGVLVQLPSIPSGGVPSVDGSLVLGIGTQSNNLPASVTTYPANSAGEFTTIFNGISLTTSFIDSGSNGLYFIAPASQLPRCSFPDSDFYCPSGTVSLSATNTGAFGLPRGAVSFQIGNFDSLTNSTNNVFSEIGGNGVGGFDWGLPFFLGRNVFVGFDGTRSSLGSGPYWAY